jgi:hypothetical protein
MPRRGQVVVLFAALIVLLVMMCALSIDVGRIVTSHAQLQNAVDAAALAGASQLVGFIDESSKQAAREQALTFAAANGVAGEPLNLGDDGIQFGHYDADTWDFVPEAEFGPGQVVDSIQVTGLRTQGAPDGPIDLFFASIFGMHGAAQARRAVATQPRRYVMFVMDRSGSMCFDTTNIDLRSSPNTNGSMSKSTTGWYWMPHKIYTSSWKTAYFYAKNDSTGQMVTDFLPSHIRSHLLSGTYFRYLAPDDVSTIQSGWLKAPSDVTIYSYYGSSYSNWSADAYGPVSSCDYALARNPIEPVASSQNAAMAFVDLLNTERDEAGLVTYAWAAILEHTLTDNFAALKTSIAAYDPRGATATPAGMQAANDEFILSGRANAYGHRIMVLLTDGMANTVSGTYYNNPSSRVTVSFFGEQVSCYIYQAVATALETQTRRAHQNGIRIYTVSFGQSADQDLMPRIARATNGAYYYAADHQDLTDIFRDIFYNLPAVLTK